MNYVVVDLEWNQAMNSQASVFNKLPIRLRGEIIEIGAVKLNEDMTPGEEFTVDVKPVYFKRMHYKVKKLTGFDKERLNNGLPFPEALAKFREWCGDGVTFLTWGYDDRGIMEQNIIIHDLDWDWIEDWVNLQLIYSMQVSGDREQKSLASAMEHFGIEQTRVAHDALGDAYNTGLVCSHLDMENGLRHYHETASRSGDLPSSGSSGPEPLKHDCISAFASKGDAFADERVSLPRCPVCGRELSLSKWVDQGDHRYMNLADCPGDGKYLLRLRFRRGSDGQYTVNRLIYEADEAMQNYYAAKAAQPRRRGRGRSKRKKKVAQKKGTVE